MGESSNPIETLTPQTQEKRYNTAPYCVSSMDSAAPEPRVDLTVGADDVVDGPATSKGHRGLDDTWDHFKKIKLDSNAAKTLHRNYDAICKGCAERVVGKPEKMRRHLVNCSKAAPTSQLHALKQQARRAGSHASQSCSQSNQGPDMDTHIDRVRVTPRQKETWWYLLAVAFIMTGWSFKTIENPQFIDFMAHVRPNSELPSEIRSIDIVRNHGDLATLLY